MTTRGLLNTKVIAVASQAVMDDRIMVAHPVRIPARNFAMVPTKCPNMFSGTVEAHPCPKFKNKFPNLYLEPMQYNNPKGKWQDVIPYMIILNTTGTSTSARTLSCHMHGKKISLVSI